MGLGWLGLRLLSHFLNARLHSSVRPSRMTLILGINGRSCSETARMLYSCAKIKAVASSAEREWACSPTILDESQFRCRRIKRQRNHLHIELKKGIQYVNVALFEISLAERLNLLHHGVWSRRGRRPTTVPEASAKPLSQAVINTEQSIAVPVVVWLQPPVIRTLVGAWAFGTRESGIEEPSRLFTLSYLFDIPR